MQRDTYYISSEPVALSSAALQETLPADLAGDVIGRSLTVVVVCP